MEGAPRTPDPSARQWRRADRYARYDAERSGAELAEQQRLIAAQQLGELAVRSELPAGERAPDNWVTMSHNKRDLQALNRAVGNRSWHPIRTSNAIKKVVETSQLQPGQRRVILGSNDPKLAMLGGGSPNLGLFKTFTEAGLYPNDPDRSASNTLATFDNFPDAPQLQTFLNANTFEQTGNAAAWRPEKPVPYMVIDGDNPANVQFGLLDPATGTRTEAMATFGPNGVNIPPQTSA